MFSYQIRTGNFDRMMLRPRKLPFQVLCSAFELSRLGRIIQAVAVLVFVLLNIQIKWTFILYYFKDIVDFNHYKELNI